MKSNKKTINVKGKRKTFRKNRGKNKKSSKKLRNKKNTRKYKKRSSGGMLRRPLNVLPRMKGLPGALVNRYNKNPTIHVASSSSSSFNINNSNKIQPYNSQNYTYPRVDTNKLIEQNNKALTNKLAREALSNHKDQSSEITTSLFSLPKEWFSQGMTVFNRRRILDFVTSKLPTDIHKLSLEGPNTETIVNLIDQVIKKILSELKIVDCNTITQILTMKIVGMEYNVGGNIVNCEELKEKFIDEFNTNGLTNLHKMTKDHSIELRTICLDIGMNLLLSMIESNKESLQQKLEYYSNEIKNKLDKEFDKIIEDGFVSYFERLIVKEYTNPFDVSKLPDKEKADLITELEKINAQYEKSHVSLLNISTQGQIYKSVIGLLDGWNSNIDKYQDKITNVEDKKKFYYLILLSSLDLRLGSILEFYCSFPGNDKLSICSSDVIKTLKLSYFNKDFIFAILNEKISEIFKAEPIDPSKDPEKYLNYWIDINE